MNCFLPAGATIENNDAFGAILALAAPGGRAEIALHGAHVLSFVTASEGSRPVLWLSRRTGINGAKPIRGGVPICAPWFGPHPNARTAPAHGLLRLRPWTLRCVEVCEGGDLCATLSVDLPREDSLGWNHDASAIFTVRVGAGLTMELSVRNTGAGAFLLSEALHTYFAVSNVGRVRVEGLEDTDYLAYSGDGLRHRHGGSPVVMDAGAANVFYTGRPVRIVDEEWGRAIEIVGGGARATVVWNPWDKAAAAQEDILDQWPEFLCVENANFPDVAVPLAPSMSHTLTTKISVSRL
jgi:glucose-6-phosphate 1-epimerase